MDNFKETLRNWFNLNKRDLPWRENNNPYSVWISEIILQQTRVAQGTSYFVRFMERFPDIKSLADATQEEVLMVWQGLGYYSRARNLHFAARQIMEEFNGEFPSSFEKISKLKGIGNYTASAIASISFNLPYAVLDGNVYRVLARVFGIQTPANSHKGEKEFSKLANHLLDKNNPGLYNEAIMDFGSLQCLPRNPFCSGCPFENLCFANNNHLTDQLPSRTEKPKQKERFFNYLYIRYNDGFYLQKREGNDIWHNLYQFPLIETEGILELSAMPEFADIFNGSEPVLESVSLKKHLLSHQKLHIRFYKIKINKPLHIKSYLTVSHKNAFIYPLPKPVNDYLLKEVK